MEVEEGGGDGAGLLCDFGDLEEQACEPVGDGEGELGGFPLGGALAFGRSDGFDFGDGEGTCAVEIAESVYESSWVEESARPGYVDGVISDDVVSFGVDD